MTKKKGMIIKVVSNIRILFISLAVILVLTVISDLFSKSEMKYRMKAQSIERKLNRIEREGVKCMDDMKDYADTDFSMGMIDEIALNTEYDIFIYEGGKLSFWTDNTYSVPVDYDSILFGGVTASMQNRFFVLNTLKDSSRVFVCLISFHREYDIENKYIRSGYEDIFKLPANTEYILSDSVDYPIYNNDGDYLFSLCFDKTSNFITPFTVIPVILWILFSIILFILVDKLVSWLFRNDYRLIGFVTAILAVIIYYFVFLILDRPEIIIRMDVFSPFRFTLGSLIPSPGHLLLISVLFVYICFSFYRHFPMPECSGENPGRGVSVLLLFLGMAALIFFFFSRLLSIIIFRSNINFEVYKILDLDYFSLIAFLSVSMIMAGFGIFVLKVFRSCNSSTFKSFVAAAIIVTILLYILNYLYDQNPLIHSLIFILLLVVAWIFSDESSRVLNVSVSFALVAAAYSAFIIPGLNWQKETENLKVLSVNYSNENDAYAEALLIDLWDELSTDSVLQEAMNASYFENSDLEYVYSYLDKEYFSNYWDNYEKIYTVCRDDSPLYFEGETTVVESCFDFFRSRSGEMGIPLTDSNLVFLDNNYGRAYYLASIYYDSDISGQTGLFIELINLVKYIQPGYPELLQDKKNYRQTNIGDYSVAKYINDSLVMQKGEYHFDPFFNRESDDSLSGNIVAAEGFEYFMYNDSQDDVAVVIARPILKLTDRLITFTYFFIFFFFLFLIIILIIRPPDLMSLIQLNFTHKLQSTFVLILLVSIIAIGTVVLSLSISQYQLKHYENIEEKLGSVFIELDHKLSGVDALDAGWSTDSYPNLDALLIKFSNVFKTDINLYNTEGELFASSRRELFNKELTSARMNLLAFNKLAKQGESQFIHKEKIGELEYLSAYTPFVNYKNEVQAYLNLPYFNMQSRISKEISNLFIAIVNFSLILLVITMGVAVFISARITNPLRMLQQGLASVKLGEKSQALEYKGHDEISELVKQYNLMLDELQNSALRLARSEREDAWREMAKQIAHEIKNPLTPMKLNIQQLFKTWHDKPENFDKTLKQFTDNQIENIDRLSSIATEFTNFARMPKASPHEIDLLAYLYSVVELYRNIRKTDINVNCNGLKELIIYADREQTNSMLSNLMRNAVQAIPVGKEGQINVSLSVTGDKALVKIEDNGVGIPDELRNKLFTPNFTTKSSGMGLGLAIVKRIVETANGKIWFDSEIGTGTCFYIEYPVLSYSKT